MVKMLILMLVTSLASLGVSSGCDTPAEAPPPADAAPEPAAADPAAQWLERLEARGRNVRSFHAKIVCNTISQDSVTYMGNVDYLAEDTEGDQSAKFRIHFTHEVINGAARKRLEEIIFDGSWLVEKNHEKKMFVKRQIVAPGERFNPLSVDGPFPVPLGQKREHVMARFNVEVIDDAPPAPKPEGDAEEHARPPLHLRMTPREDVPVGAGQRAFDRIDLWYDRDTLMPVKVEASEGAEQTLVKLRDVTTNVLEMEDAAELFDTAEPQEGEAWRVEVKPWGQ